MTWHIRFQTEREVKEVLDLTNDLRKHTGAGAVQGGERESETAGQTGNGRKAGCMKKTKSKIVAADKNSSAADTIFSL